MTDALGRLVRNAQALLASAAGEVAKRSSIGAGRHGLAKKQGFQSPTRMVAAATERAGDGAAVLDDRRTIGQMQADALAMVARHVLGCTRMPSAPAMTVVVRTELSTVTEGTGFAEIDGADHPISAGAARRIAAAAELIPVVFDGGSLPLDLGRDARLFTRAQRLALSERDGGCACCGVDAAYVEAHHIRWWQRDAGPTDLDNGVLLCPPCHTRVHSDGWQIIVRDREVWFTPPARVDSARRPRLGGKARFSLTARDAA